jgi:hypothetical protein
MFTQLKAIIASAILLVVLIIAGLIYWRGSSNATTKNDLRVARETIKVEREALKITTEIDMRVNAEGIQTASTAQEATREIEAIRKVASVVGVDPRTAVHDSRGSALDFATSGDGCDHSCARVLQLAREARAAALASSAKLQPASAGAR